MKRFIKNTAVICLTGLLLGATYISNECSAAKTATIDGESSINISSQDYEKYTSPINSYLVTNEDGTITRVEAIVPSTGVGYLLIENYDTSFGYQTSKRIELELPIFGGFYSGTEYNYVVVGQPNLNEDDSVEVVKVVKYNKKWERISSSSLTGINTQTPFAGGTCRMCESEGKLYIRTSHKMYKATDGKNHQSNMTLVFDQSSMKLVDSQYAVGNVKDGYISHSFNQFITTSDSKIYTVDHGDAYPRSVVAGVYNYTTKTDGTVESDWTTANLFDFTGTLGNNITGASVGGFEASTSKLLVAGNSVPQDTGAATYKVRNIYLASINKDMNTDKTFTWITNYKESDLYSVSTPQMIKVTENYYMLIWELKTRDSVNSAFTSSNTINYIFVDGSGKLLTDVLTADGSLSDCKPVVYNGKVTWYVTSSSAPTFYTLKINGEKEDPAPVGETIIYQKYKYTVTKCDGTVYEVAAAGQVDSNNGITKLSVPEKVLYNGHEYTVTSIAAGAFKSTKTLKKVTLPLSINTIGKNAFRNCTALTSFTIKKNVTTIESKAFYKCSKLSKITFKGKKVSSIGKSAFKGIKKKAVFKVPSSKVKKYTKLLTSKTGFTKYMKIKK